jgi:hypothetical protein
MIEEINQILQKVAKTKAKTLAKPKKLKYPHQSSV